jgi:hypothetical protein
LFIKMPPRCIVGGPAVFLFFSDGLASIGDGGTLEVGVSVVEEGVVGTCDGDFSVISWELEAY